MKYVYVLVAGTILGIMLNRIQADAIEKYVEEKYNKEILQKISQIEANVYLVKEVCEHKNKR